MSTRPNECGTCGTDHPSSKPCPKPKRKTARERRIEVIRDKYKGRRMSPYGIAILEDILPVDPDVRPEDTQQIEETMRTQYPTLDNIDHKTFRRLARICWQAVQELREDEIYETTQYPEE